MRSSSGFLVLGLAFVALLSQPAKGGLVAHYNFDGNSLDQSGSGNDGTLINGASYVADSPLGGQSLALQNDGTVENQGMNVPGSATLGANPFTLAYWIKPTSAQGNAGLDRLTSREGDRFETAIGDANAVGGTTSATGVTLSYYQGGWNVTNVEISTDAWTHVAWVNSGPGASDMELYLNGTSAFSGIGVDGSIDRPGTGFMNVGTRHNEVEGFEGYLDDFRLYDTALSGDEIRSLIPEPSSFTLALLGLLIGVSRHRRQSK